MKLKTLLVVNAVIAVFFGIAYELAPASIVSFFGDITPNPGEVLLARLFGALLIGIGLLLWFLRNVRDSETQRALILSMLVCHGIGVVVTIHATVTAVMPPIGWASVAVFGLLTLGYAYFELVKPSSPSQQSQGGT